MVLLRRVIGDALRARRQGQQRTLREVSSAANVSLGYLSEIERGQKEPSSELLAAICDALGAQLSELLRDVSDTVALAEQMSDVLVPVGQGAGAEPLTPVRDNQPESARGALVPARRALPATRAALTSAPATRPAETAEPATASAALAATPRKVTPGKAAQGAALRRVTADGKVSVSVRQDSPLKTTLRATRRLRSGDQDRNRDVVCVG